MKIAVLNGSPKVGNTAAMINAFAEGAKEAGHEVEILHVGKMKIGGCERRERAAAVHLAEGAEGI